MEGVNDGAQAMKKTTTGGLVYSTDAGRMCPACRQPVAACACGQRPVRPGDGVVRVGRQTAGRGGKVVTLITGLGLDDEAATAMAKRLKAVCGCGGAVKDGDLALQGEHRDKVVLALQAEGWKVKRIGG